MSITQEFQVKNEYDDSNSCYQDYKDEEKYELNQLNESIGELTTIKTPNGNKISIYLRLGNRILFCSGKYFNIERTTAETDHQKESTGIVTTCHTCGVRIRGSLKVSSNFISHLKARHPEVYTDFLKQKRAAGTATTRRSIHRVSPYPLNSHIGSNLLQQQGNQDLFQRNVLQFLISTNQSLSLVEDASFRKLFDFLDFSVTLKTPLQYQQIIRDDCKYKQLHLANYFGNRDFYICISSDVWCFGDCKYLAVSCHWIDEQYQRQAALLACIRSSIKGGQCVKALHNDIFMRYGFQNTNVINTVTENIQSYITDFMEFGINSEALRFDGLEQTGDCTLVTQMQENLKFLNLNNEAEINASQLDILILSKIWGARFIKNLDVKTRRLHRSCMEKCSSIWNVSHSTLFKESFENILSGSLTRPNILSFSSLYNSLKQLHLNKSQLPQLCVFLEKPNFSDLELEYIEELVDIFEPLSATFEFLDMPQNHFYGCFLPTLVTLKWKLTRLYNSKKLKHLQEALLKLKEQLSTEFQLYYELNDAKSEAILAAITYPPVKTRFLPGLRDSISCVNFQARNILLKYGKDYHVDDDIQSEANIMSHKQENSMEPQGTAIDFFDFGDGTENIPGDDTAPNSLKLEIDNYLADSVDAEELRDVNISKKELSELVAELYDDLMAGGLSTESIELETPRKFLLSFQDDRLHTPHTSPDRLKSNENVTRQLEFEKKLEFDQHTMEAQAATNAISTTNKIEALQISEIETECSQITLTNCQNDYTFQPGIMSTPSTHKQNNSNNNAYSEYNYLNSDSMSLIPIAQSDNAENLHDKTIVTTSSTLNTQLELIAVPIPGQPNCFQLAKVVDKAENFANSTSALQRTENCDVVKNASSVKSLRNANNYISVKRHIIAEYIDKFKTLQHAQDNEISSTTTESMDAAHRNANMGFTQYQYDLMQQQLRIHVQQLTQTFVQTYCHPELWNLAPRSKELLLDLQEKAKENVNFVVWNLQPAIELVHNWEHELDQHTPENTELMNFLHHENYVTNQSRTIPRFHPRILDCYLNSPVFMYPQYLPRLPFSSKASIPIFSPVEAYLIAMGLEKHLQIIYEKKEKISKTTPLRAACKRLAKDTVCGKRYRRIWDHILHLQKVDYYNPIKYFFEHNRAPPVDHDPIWTFNNNVVLPPKDRIPELPLVFQTYLQKKNKPPNTKKRSSKKSSLRASEAFKNSYLEFVQEIVGQDIPMPNLFYDPAELSDTPPLGVDTNNDFAEKHAKVLNSKLVCKRKLPQSLTINVNYVYGNGLEISKASTDTSLSLLPVPSYNISYSPNSLSQNTEATSGLKAVDSTINKSNTCNSNIIDSTINSTIDLTQNNFKSTTKNTDCPVITYNFDWITKTLQPASDITKAESKVPTCSPLAVANDALIPPIVTYNNNKLRTFNKKVCRTFKLHKKIKQKASAYRDKLYLKRRCEELITTYSLYLDKTFLKYKAYPLIQHYYRYFKALELYTYLLKGLKSFCNKNFSTMSSNSPNLKRARNSNSNTEDDGSPSSTRQVRKLNRQEENLRHMLLPDTPEETNRKDAIYAFNFYDKVEEAFKIANKPEDCKKFNSILKSFDPKKDKVSDLYYKLEKLFLPDHPELAQVFLTFLLPSEAAEIGKFFEHFMINNMSTFINKLNIYFNKQPAQIRKVYNCLNDLAEDSDLTMKKVETKIVPLLKGNQFLIDWFMQQFSQNTPPERLFSKPEYINLKDQQCNRSGEYVETLTDLTDSPTNDAQQQQSCQLRYINGRIFYGSKMLLPAKLSFMAASYKDKIKTNEISNPTSSNVCVHKIREHGENRLQAAAELTSTHINPIEPPSSDDQDKSEEEDLSKGLVIDTTPDEEDSCSSVELCDESSLRAHATRLNPSVYSSCYSANAISTPNLINNFQAHHANAKKTSLNFNEEAKLSPRKNSQSSSTSTHLNLPSPIAISISNSPINTKEKRKSPTKKTKSPSTNTSKTLRTSNATVQPMVVIHETNSAIECAKRLKSLIEGETQQNESIEEPIDSKEILKIVARSKNSLRSAPADLAAAQICEDIKEEKAEELEFLTEQSPLSPSPFPCLRMETDSNEEDVYNSKTPPPISQLATPASDEYCKIEIVTSLTTAGEESTSAVATSDKSEEVLPLDAPWTRDEDKIILIEMKMGSQNRDELFQRIADKLTNRTMLEITSRHEFLMDFLSKLQGK